MASLSFRIVVRLPYILDHVRRRQGTVGLWRLLQLARRPCRLDAGVWGPATAWQLWMQRWRMRECPSGL
eukprot:11322203-Alexandrium_andersonii.AAC.1